MAATQSNDNNMVKREFMYAVTIVAFIAGFMGGVIFCTFKSDSGPTGYTQGPSPPASFQQSQAPPPSMTAEQASTILALESEVESNPGNAEAWTNLGHIYFDANKYSKAIRAYEKSLELAPGNPNVMTDLGVMYRRNGQPGKAVELFDAAIQAEPSHEQSRFNKGIVLMHDMNDVNGAIQAWEGLIAVNPFAMGPTGKSVREMVDGLKAQGSNQP
ncbi:tetratricopeptide repeat protein [Thermodesulfobacteriota bacterium]